MKDFLEILVRNVSDTGLYLLAYRGAPIAAIVASAVLIRFAPADRIRGWARAESVPLATAGAVVLGMSRPFSRREIDRNLRQLAGRPGSLVGYLTASHALTAYFLLLTGPLLGKDVLLSHLIGGAVFVVAGTAAARVLGVSEAGPLPPSEPASRRRERSLVGVLGGEAVRAGTLMLAGLLLGGAVAAWGLSAPREALVEMGGVQGGIAQLAGAVLALAVAVATAIPPLTNLFVGTYLWKVGLAHAGLVTLLYASTVSPQRVLAYRRQLGSARAWRLTLALATSALVAGLVTAGLFGATPLDINYKLIPEQMW